MPVLKAYPKFSSEQWDELYVLADSIAMSSAALKQFVHDCQSQGFCFDEIASMLRDAQYSE